jgi:ribonuclease HII
MRTAEAVRPNPKGTLMPMTVAEITRQLRQANADEFAVLERSFAADPRKGVRRAVETARRRLAAEAAEQARLDGLYDFQNELARPRNATCIVGLDEVGRGPVAGPLAVGAVVLPDEPHIPKLNDSKQLTPAEREEIAAQVRTVARAVTVQYVEPADIDADGMTACLKRAFRAAIAAIEDQGVRPDLVLIDGNPLHIDPREVTIVKGDAKCASISAASIVAKVDRDALMCRLAHEYPEYGFEKNKGYGSAEHIAAIRAHGLSPVHRASFCHAFTQESLF